MWRRIECTYIRVIDAELDLLLLLAISVTVPMVR